MQLEKFNSLSTAKKEEIIWNHGTLLDNQNEVSLTCDVYLVFDFYVAFYYEIDSRDLIGISVKKHLDELALNRNLA